MIPKAVAAAGGRGAHRASNLKARLTRDRVRVIRHGAGRDPGPSPMASPGRHRDGPAACAVGPDFSVLTAAGHHGSELDSLKVRSVFSLFVRVRLGPTAPAGNRTIAGRPGLSDRHGDSVAAEAPFKALAAIRVMKSLGGGDQFRCCDNAVPMRWQSR
jgi:hypothetical protein